MKPEQLAINTLSTGSVPLEEALPAYAAAGFQQVEFFLGHVRSFLHEGRIVGDLRRRLDKEGLRCIGGHEGVLECFSTGSLRTENHERNLINARLIAELGGSFLVVGTDGPPEGYPAEKIRSSLLDGLRHLADLTAPYGVTVCLEFGASPVVGSLRGAVDLLAECQRENLGVLFDTARYYCSPTKFEDLQRESVQWIRHVHVSDMPGKPPEWSDALLDRVLPGDGCLGLQMLLGRLDEKGYAGAYSIELPEQPMKDLPVSEAARRLHASLAPLAALTPA
jgi:2-keto-myo-inositol isomerase